MKSLRAQSVLFPYKHHSQSFSVIFPGVTHLDAGSSYCVLVWMDIWVPGLGLLRIVLPLGIFLYLSFDEHAHISAGHIPKSASAKSHV